MPAKIPKPTSPIDVLPVKDVSLEEKKDGNKTQKTDFTNEIRSDIVQKHLKSYLLAVKGTGCSLATIRNYKSDINQFLSFLGDYDLNDLRNKPKLLAFAHYQRDKGLKENSIKRKLVSITQFKIWLKQEGLLTSEIPLSTFEQSDSENNKNDELERKIIGQGSEKKTKEVPKPEEITQELTQKKKKKPRSRLLILLNLLALFLFLGGLAYFAYQQFGQAIISMAYPSTPTAPNRILSYQGRLTDIAQSPISIPTNMTYKLFNADTAGTELWSSNTCSIDPDQDGIFNANLGAGAGAGADTENCGGSIAESVFTENTNVWLEVAIGAEILAPRQPIRTVPYALNAGTLQGLPPAEIATNSTILMMNSAGEVVLGTDNPVIKAATTSSGMTIEANQITIKTTAGSNGDIILAPDGTGILDIQGSASVSGETTLIGNTYVSSANTLIFGGTTALGEITSPTDSGAYLIGAFDEFGNSSSTNVQGVLNDLDSVISGLGTPTWSSLTAPSANLSLNHSTYSTAFNWATGTGTSDLFSLTSDAAADGTGSIFNVQSGVGSTLSPLRIRAGSTEAIFVNSSGNVGIGDITPDHKLDVTGNIGLDAGGYINWGDTDGATGYGLRDNAGTIQYKSSSGDWADIGSGTGGDSFWQSADGALYPGNSTLDLLIGGISTASAKFAFTNIDSGTPTFSMANQASAFNLLNSTVNALNIESGLMSFDTANSRVGIGTTTPGALLSLQSTAANESAILGSELLSASDAWGTTGWTGDFNSGFTHVVGNTTALTNTTVVPTAGYRYRIYFIVGGRPTSGSSFTIGFGGKISSSYSNTDTFIVDATTADTLTVTPTTDFNGSFAVSIKRITSYGPTFALYDNTGTSSFEIRNSAASLYNTFLGKNTGSYNTTGNNNTAQGSNSLLSNVTGSGNTAQGSSSLSYNTTGNSNTAQGSNSLLSNITGGSNTAQGSSSLSYNTTGNNNTAQGVLSLFSNTIGNGNTAQGVNSLYFNTTGSYNVAQGINSLFRNTTGSYNVAQGDSSLYYNTTGSYNTALGRYSLNLNTTGYNNTAVGTGALGGNTYGYQNSALGSEAGRYISGGPTNSTPTNSLYLGASTKALYGGDDNEIVIGYDATGAGSNSVTLGNDSITKTLLKGNVGIGVADPTSRLQIAGATSTISNDTGDITLDAASGNIAFSGNNLININDGYFAGAVGIGTVTPARKLEIIDAASPQMRLTQTSGSIYSDFQMTSNGDLVMNVDGVSNQLVLDNGGNIGIGITNPDEKLSVNGSINAEKYYDYTNKNYFLDPAAVGTGLNLAGDALVGGSVGIGTTSLIAKLSISNTTAASTVAPIVLLDSGYTDFSSVPTIDFSINGNYSYQVARIGAPINGDVSGNLAFYTNATDSRTTVATEKMRITGSGNVGIGTTAPTAKLHISGTNTGTNQYGMHLDTTLSGTERNYGVRIAPTFSTVTSLNSYGLDIRPYFSATSGGPQNSIYNITSIPTITAAATANITNLTNGYFRTDNSSTAGSVVANNYSLFVANPITSAGGITNNYGLYIASQASGASSNFALYSAGGTNYFAGNVGIGTTTPVAKLHIGTSTSGSAPMLYSWNTFPQFPRTLQNISDSITTNDATVGTGAVIGLNLENSSTTDNTYSPLITFSRRSPNSAYNTTFASIGGFNTGQGTDASWTKGDLIFGTADGAGPVERMRINSIGNVGIGTTSPQASLHIDKDGVNNIIIRSTASNAAANTTLEALGIYRMAFGVATTAFYTYYTDSSNVARYIATTGTAIDLAEWYKVGSASLDSSGNSKLKKGQLLCIDSSATEKVVACSTENNQLIGIVSTQSYQTMGMNDLDDDHHDATEVALAGRVPLITTIKDSQQIKSGDHLAASSLIGVSAKATQVGETVAKALDNTNWTAQSCPTVSSLEDINWPSDDGTNKQKPCFTLPDGSIVGKVMAFVNVSWYNPNLYLALNDQVDSLAKIGDNISLADLDQIVLTGDDPEAYAVATPAGIADRIAAFADIFVARLTAGFIKTKELAAEKIAVDTLTSNNEELNIATSAAILGDLKVDQDLEVAGETKLGQLNVQNASISGELTANSIEANSARLDYIESKLANLETASVSGTLYADNIEANSIHANVITGLEERLSSKIAETLDQPSILAALLNETQQQTDEYLQQLQQEIVGIASESSTLAEINATSDDLALIADTAFINQYFEVNGNAYIANSLKLGQSLLVGDSTIIGDGFISYQPELAEGEDFTFSIQPTGMGKLSLMAGLMQLDSHGLVTINGDLKVAGVLEVSDDLKVKGTLLTNLISADNPDENIQVKLGSNEFEFINENDTSVASFSSSGDLALTGSLRLGQNTEVASDSGELIIGDRSAGQAVLPAGSTEVIISSDKIEENSMIYVTPMNSTNNQVLYVKNKITDSPFTPENEAQFTVAIDYVLGHNVTFNWWIIQLN